MRVIRNSIDRVAALVAQMPLQAEITHPEMPLWDLIWTSFSVAAFAGIATLLYEKNKELTWRSSTAAVLYTGVCGTTTALLLAGYGQADPRVLLGASGAVGIGAIPVFSVIESIRKGHGFKIEVRKSGDDHDVPKDL